MNALRFADSWLHAGNAAMTMTAPPPPNLSLPLGAARTIPPRPAAEILRNGVWTAISGPVLSISLVLTDTRGSRGEGAVTAAVQMIGGALTKMLCEEWEVASSVAWSEERLSADQLVVPFVIDADTDQMLVAAKCGLDVIRSLAAEGPGIHAMNETRAEWLDEYATAERAVALQRHAIAVLRGWRAADDLDSPDPASVTDDELWAIFRAAAPTVVVGIPTGLVQSDPAPISEAFALPLAPTERPFISTLSSRELFRELSSGRARGFSPRKFLNPGGIKLIIDPERVTLGNNAGMMEVRFDRLALAGYSLGQNAWILLADDGDFLSIALNDWRKPEAIHQLLAQLTPREVQYITHESG